MAPRLPILDRHSLRLLPLCLLAGLGCGKGPPPKAPSAASARQAQALAVLELADPAQHDFGPSLEGARLEHTFRFQVAGTEALRVISVNKSCGCTRGDLFVVDGAGGRSAYTLNAPLPAGTALELVAAFDSLGRTGKQAKSIVLYGNLPTGRQEFALLADVRPFLVATPEVLDLGRFLIGATPEAGVELAAQGAQRLSLAPNPEGLTEELEVSLEPLDLDDSGRASRFRLTARPGPGILAGVRSFPLSFQSDLAADGQALDGRPLPALMARVTVHAEVLPLVEALPPATAFGPLGAGVAFERSLEIRVRVPGLDLLAVPAQLSARIGETAVDDAFRFELLPLDQLPSTDPPTLAAYRLRVFTDGLPAGPAGTLLGRVTFELGLERQADFAVGISGIARGR